MLRLYIAHGLPRDNQASHVAAHHTAIRKAAQKRTFPRSPRSMRGALLAPAFFSLCLLAALTAAQEPPPARPAARAPAAGLTARLDAIVQKSIEADELPGAVLLVSRQGRILHRRAYGARAVLPQREAMTPDTI